MSTETTTQKWYQSKIVKLSIALILAGGSFFLVSYNLVDPTDLTSAESISPELYRGIELLKTGQWLSGFTAIGGALILYFRVFKTTSLIPQSLKE